MFCTQASSLRLPHESMQRVRSAFTKHVCAAASCCVTRQVHCMARSRVFDSNEVDAMLDIECMLTLLYAFTRLGHWGSATASHLQVSSSV
jgi:hypothetical protein